MVNCSGCADAAPTTGTIGQKNQPAGFGQSAGVKSSGSWKWVERLPISAGWLPGSASTGAQLSDPFVCSPGGGPHAANLCAKPLVFRILSVACGVVALDKFGPAGRLLGQLVDHLLAERLRVV
jgi:hypothetical protein